MPCFPLFRALLAMDHLLKLILAEMFKFKEEIILGRFNILYVIWILNKNQCCNFKH